MNDKEKTLKPCPFRVYGERQSSWTIEGEYYYKEWFMPCMEKGCACFHRDGDDAYCDRNGAYMRLTERRAGMKGRLYTRTFQKVRYDLKQKKYTDRYIVPDDQRIVTTTMDMKLQCNCAECGRVVLYGDTWSSRVWYDESGVWSLPVCRACHEAEIKAELEANTNDRKAT